MTTDELQGKWKQLKGSVKQRWGKLTDDDLTFINGKKDELIGRIQERYGITREQAMKEADEWARQANLESAAHDTYSTTATGKVR